MQVADVLNTAHIHLDCAILRVHVDNVDNYDFDRMEAFKPDCVTGVGKSSDPHQNRTSFLVHVSGDYDLRVHKKTEKVSHGNSFNIAPLRS